MWPCRCPRAKAWFAIRGHVWVHSPTVARVCFEGHAAAMVMPIPLCLHCHWGHGGLWDQVASEDQVSVCDLTGAGIYVTVHGPCHHQETHTCPGSTSQPVAVVGTKGCDVTKAMKIWVACPATSDHGVYWRPHVGPWPYYKC